ncbi:hypothetical protein [Nafulsella turpanensis]|uniref:hypothetical protein n=1 Tax=Nafulsella turpanensis TaxID=1265690 RepID=UPI00034DE6D9|nr:hypothetical protein [Nafulsella turpanensis]
MNEHPHRWLKSFSLSALTSYCLQHTSTVFEYAKKGLGGEYIRQMARQYAHQHHLQLPPEKSLNMDYTARYEGFEALFIQAWPCLLLSLPPVYLAAVRIENQSLCRVFRMNSMEPGQLYLNELTAEERDGRLINVPTYKDASALIFSYTLGTPCFTNRAVKESWMAQEAIPRQQSVIH